MSTSAPQKTELRQPAASAPSPYGAGDGEPMRTEPELLLGRYSLLESRATGGFGSVEVCWDTRLQRRVAIKKIPLASDAGYIGTSSVEDAVAEARTASLLSHPNIVTMFDFESDAVFAYLVMEYIDGLSLAELLQRVEGGVLTYDELAHVLLSVGHALAFAHENGVLHLDIKPANILIDRAGTVKLSDFGMAALASAAGYGGARGGTVGYMSPEQITGSLVDERSDVFSLAVVAWEALTGTNPFAAPTAEKSLEAIYKGPRPALSKSDPELAGTVETTLLAALAPEPAQRSADVAAFAETLATTLGDQEVGQASLRQLLGQVAEDEEAGIIPAAPQPNVAQRLPWLYPTIWRVSSAACAGWLAWIYLAPILGNTSWGAPVACIACAAIGALSPRYGSLLMIVAIALRLFVSAGAQGLAVGGALVGIAAFFLLMWWASIGRTHELAGLALFVPTALGNPATALSLAPYALPPLSAALTAAIAYLGARIAGFITAAGFDLTVAWMGIRTMLAQPSAWVWLGGTALAGCICSALTHSRSKAVSIAGQILALFLLIVTSAIAARVENGGIWQPLRWDGLALAVLLGLFVSLVIAVFGPPDSDEKGD